jgi:hypothetical protein
MSGGAAANPRAREARTEPPEGELFRSVRTATAAVVQRARSVHIDGERLEALAERLSHASPTRPTYDSRHHHLGAPESTVAFILTLDTINFGSGFFPYLHKRSGLSGYFTIATGLKERFDNKGPWSAPELTEMEPEHLAPVLGQELGTPQVAELLRLFARALNDLGRLLLNHYEGRFEAIVEEAGGSPETLVRALSQMLFYRDISRYEELEVPFYKRAQLAVADLFLAFQGSGFGRFPDVQGLTAFADNLLPHVLRLEGVLAYDRDLLERIEAGQEIPAGSLEEVEIRAAAVHAVELLADTLQRHDVRLNAHEIDHALWHRGQRAKVKAHPRHRTRSVFY